MSKENNHYVHCPHCNARQRFLTLRFLRQKVWNCRTCNKPFSIKAWVFRETWGGTVAAWAVLLTFAGLLFVMMRNPPSLGQTLFGLFITIPMACFLMGILGAYAGIYLGRYWLKFIHSPIDDQSTALPPARYVLMEPIDIDEE